MKFHSLVLVISILASGYGDEADNLPPSINSAVRDEQSVPSSSGMKKVTLEACRRNPTWRGEAVDHYECRRLTGWKPRDFWWRVDKNHTQEILEGQEQAIVDCIDDHFRRAKEAGIWWAL